jgi:hypothetical protein
MTAPALHPEIEATDPLPAPPQHHRHTPRTVALLVRLLLHRTTALDDARHESNRLRGELTTMHTDYLIAHGPYDHRRALERVRARARLRTAVGLPTTGSTGEHP